MADRTPPAPGLTIGTSSGTISGTPTTVGQFTFTVQATDSANAANYGVRVLTLNVTPIQVSQPVPNANLGASYSTTFTPTGGTAPYSWSLAAGNLMPAGLTFSNGVLSGTPTTEGQFFFNYIVADSAGNTFHGGAGISIFPPLLPQTISFAALNNVVLGTAAFPVNATASSGLPVSFASTTSAVCTVSGATVTLVAAGTCAIQATQSGNTTYAPAVPVNQGFQVMPPPRGPPLNRCQPAVTRSPTQSRTAVGRLAAFWRGPSAQLTRRAV